MKLGLKSQVELTPKTVGAKCGETNQAWCNADFSKIFWSKTLKYYCTSDFYQFLKLLDPKQFQFRKKSKKLKFHKFFTFFLENGCKCSKNDSITSLNMSNGFIYLLFWLQNIKKWKMKVSQISDKLGCHGILMKISMVKITL